MKGPMKGATIAHAKQRRTKNRYIGITEPGIIAAESPNPIVNHLVIMPDIEKRLEAFVRMGHGIIVFPGGVGTAEEILYLLGLMLHPDNADLAFPLILTGPKSSAAYFEQIDQFLRLTLGEAATSPLPDHRRRPAAGGAGDGAGHPQGARAAAADQGRVLLQLGAARAGRLPAAVPPEPRDHGRR